MSSDEIVPACRVWSPRLALARVAELRDDIRIDNGYLVWYELVQKFTREVKDE